MRTDVGLVRAYNEDCCEFSLAGNGGNDGAARDSLMLVADGMGGHAAGEVASRLAADVIRIAYFQSAGPAPQRLLAAFQLANRAIREHAASHPECIGMGTTCTALVVREDRAYLGHIGDSRAYLLRKKALNRLSHDQTLAAKLVTDGILSAAQAKLSGHDNIILQALGGRPDAAPEVWNDGISLAPGDVLVLCTDGLHGLVDEVQIAELAGSLPPDEACQELIARARLAGGHDNITVGVFQAKSRSDAEAAAARRQTKTIGVPPDLFRSEATNPSALTRPMKATTRQP